MCRLAWRWRWLACSSCTRSHGLCTSREMSTRAVPLVSEHWTSRPDILYSLYPRLEYIPLEPILIKKKHLFGHVSPPNCMKNFRARKVCTHFLFLTPISGANNAVYHTTHYLRLVFMSWIYYPWTHFNLKKSFWACFPQTVWRTSANENFVRISCFSRLYSVQIMQSITRHTTWGCCTGFRNPFHGGKHSVQVFKSLAMLCNSLTWYCLVFPIV